MKKIRCIIVDDDKAAIKLLEHFVSRTDYLQLLESFDSAKKAGPYIEENHVDLIFLDVEMPGMSGLDLLGSLNDPPRVILNTSKEGYAKEAYDYQVVDFLLKPASPERFQKAVEKVKTEMEAELKKAPILDTKNIFVKQDNLMERLRLDDIYYVEALGDYVNIHLLKGMKTVLTTMKNVEMKLPETRFTRVHRSYIVNREHISSFDSAFVIVKEKLIPLGNSYKKTLTEKLNLL